mgnify:FL=1
MNAVGIALLWCVVQVTLLAAVCGVLYLIVHRLRSAAAAPVVLAGLLTIVLLTVLAVVPWPRWQFAWTTPPHESGSPHEDGRASVAGNVGWDSVPTGSGQSPSLQKREGLSGAIVWWQTVLEDLSRPQPIAPEPGWQWPALLAVLMFTAAGVGTAWLTLGLLAVRAQRRRSRPVEDAALNELVDTLRAELNCLRRIEVRQSSDLTTAATIGWRRPVILLPSLWTDWTAEQRRAVLAHEIGHVRRNDFLAVACGQLGVMLHFYHPLLHWLMSRLRLEQELAADAAAAGVVGGQRAYLLTLAELALRQADQPLAWPARTFLPTQSAFLRRIAMLRNTRLRVARVSPIARGLAVGTVLACGLLIAGLRGPAIEPGLLAQDFTKARAEKQ